MTRTETKRQAQEKLMGSLAATILSAKEHGEHQVIIDEMTMQSIRIGMFLGFTSWPGIYSEEYTAAVKRRT